MSNKLEQQEAKHHCFLMHTKAMDMVSTHTRKESNLALNTTCKFERNTLEQSTITKCDKQNAIPLTINPNVMCTPNTCHPSFGKMSEKLSI